MELKFIMKRRNVKKNKKNKKRTCVVYFVLHLLYISDIY